MNFIKQHKFVTALVLLIIIGGSYYTYSKLTATTAPTRYVLETASKQTLISSVSGTGQVSLLNQVNITPKIAGSGSSANLSGNLTAVNVVNGQAVKAGDVIAKIDCSDLTKQLRDARISLASAQVSMAKLKRGSTPADLKAANDKVASAQKSLADAGQALIDTQNQNVTDLNNKYSDAVTTLNDAYNKANDIVTNQINPLFKDLQTENPSLNFITSDPQLSASAVWKRAAAINTLKDLKNTVSAVNCDQNSINAALNTANSDLATVTDFFNNLSNAANSGVATLDTPQNTLNSYAASANSARSSIIGLSNNITAAQRAITNQITTNKNNITAANQKISNANDSLTQAKDNLSTMQAGPDSFDVKSQQISLQQRINAVTDIEQNLGDCTIKAPFDGVVSTINFQVGDAVTSASNITTLLTTQKIASITLNEVDVAKIKIGQKATLTFDALPDLSLAGTVNAIDAIGTVSQGVVTYGVKISLDSQDDRVKAGMTVAASIITEVHADVLAVSTGSVKQNTNGDSYVLIIDNPITTSGVQGVTTATSTREQIVTTGASTDALVEIISGLNDGDSVVSKTVSSVSASKKTTSASATSLLGGGGGGGFGR